MRSSFTSINQLLFNTQRSIETTQYKYIYKHKKTKINNTKHLRIIRWDIIYKTYRLRVQCFQKQDVYLLSLLETSAMDTIIIFLDPTSLHMNLYIQVLKTALKVGTLLETNISLALLLLGIVIYVSCAAPLSRSQRSLIRADTGRGVTQDLALAGQYWPHLESC